MSVITPHFRTVRDLLQGHSFSIDEYQREYKWAEKNIDELVTDLQEKFSSCYQAGDSTQKVSNYEGYFLGSIIVSNRNGKSYLIDGQQRITSLTLLLIHLYREAKRLQNGLDGLLEPLIFSNNYGKQIFNLDIAERLPVIEALFNGNTEFNPEGMDESIQTMYQRYGDIEKQGLADELKDSFPHFIYWLLNKVGLIEISTDNDNYAYAIFETMNDRGKPLSPVDMLKAYLLAPISDAERRKAANQTWKHQVLGLISWGGEHEPERDSVFIKAWFRAQYADSIRERKAGSSDRDWELIGTTFHRWARDNCARFGWGTEDANLSLINQNFTFFAKAYQLILDASAKYTTGLESVYYIANNEFTWASTVLLAPLELGDSDEIIKTKLQLVATYLDIWLMRRIVNYVRMSYAAANYSMFLLTKEIRRKSVGELRELLVARLATDEISFDSYPSKGREGIQDFRLNQFSRRYIYHILARLTSYIETNSGKPDLFDKYVNREDKNAVDIEHIWANDYDRFKSVFSSNEEFQRSRNHIAGLLLLPADVNRSYQDKSFADKSPHYAKHNLLAASLTPSAYEHQPQFLAFKERSGLPFEPYTEFGVDEQAKRRVLIEQLVKKVWSPERLEQ